MKKDFWKDRKILITGGAGLLGAEMVYQLANLGADITLILRDHLSKSRLHTSNLTCKK